MVGTFVSRERTQTRQFWRTVGPWLSATRMRMSRCAVPALIATSLMAAPAGATTYYAVGNAGSVSITPASTATWQIEVWGAGAAGDDGTGNGGPGGGYAKKTSFAATSGTPVNINLGAPGVTSAQAGGDTWLGTSGTVIANGGGSATARIGDSTSAGGAGGSYLGFGLPGGGGAGSAGFTGAAGGSPPGGGVNTAGGGGGGGNGGGFVGNVNTVNSVGGSGGQSASIVAGGAGGFSVGAANGSPGSQGSGGGGGYGDGTSTAGSGGNGGDNYNAGGGGAGGPGAGAVGVAQNGGNGGTPGGGGSDRFNSGVIGQGGWSVIKITYTGTDPDKIFVYGTIPLIQIPSSWNSTATATNTTAGCTSSTIPVTPGGTLAVAVQGGCPVITLTKLSPGGGTHTGLLLGVGN